MSKILSADVIVVGGGISGLSAGVYLSRKDISVIVLEARERVGGRTYSVETEAGVVCDLGGAYVGPTQDRILRVASEFGIETEMVYNTGAIQFRVDGVQIRSGTQEFPPLSIFELLDMNRVIVAVENLISKIKSTENTESWPIELDSISAKDWFSQNITSEKVRQIFPRILDSILCKDSSEVSMLYFIWYGKCGDCLKRLMEISHGAQERTFVNGSQQISNSMAKELNVRFNSVVARIDQTHNDIIHITCRDGTVFNAAKVIIAISPPLYSKIEWMPELPPSKIAIAKDFSMGHIIKTNMFYETAWWRKDGFSGQIFDPSGPVLYSIDCSKQRSNSLYPCLMGFVLANDAKKWAQRSPEERKRGICEQYASLFNNNTLALAPLDYLEQNWNDEEFSAGCYVASPSIGSFVESVPHLREPFDHIHFAGTELATV